MSKSVPAFSTDRFAWTLVGGMALTTLFACGAAGFMLDLRRALLPAGGLLVLLGGVVAGRRLGRPRLTAGSSAFLQMTLFSILGVALSYALAAGAGPVWDAQFAAADAALGFDWPAVYRAADAMPAALWVGGIAYHSLTLHMIVCIVALAGTRRFAALRVCVAAAILAGFVTVLASGVLPGNGIVVDPAGYRNLWPSIAWLERDLVAGLRDGSLRTLDLGQLMGIVTFPSYHATLPLIFIWAQREVPYLRIVGPVWAGLTIIATPLFGGHHGVDVLAGLALAPPAIYIARRLVLGTPLATVRSTLLPFRARAVLRGQPKTAEIAE
jgi:hypothetical protein